MTVSVKKVTWAAEAAYIPAPPKPAYYEFAAARLEAEAGPRNRITFPRDQICKLCNLPKNFFDAHMQVTVVGSTDQMIQWGVVNIGTQALKQNKWKIILADTTTRVISEKGILPIEQDEESIKLVEKSIELGEELIKPVEKSTMLEERPGMLKAIKGKVRQYSYLYQRVVEETSLEVRIS
jgi:hypothetical protein